MTISPAAPFVGLCVEHDRTQVCGDELLDEHAHARVGLALAAPVGRHARILGGGPAARDRGQDGAFAAHVEERR